ncbi:MAG: NAD(P)-dependent oxidoreductase [Saprospiraceae bacterium]|nr:NAD(P)-dependent oxidoreductase [Saprospiraceae bacterium]
MKKILITGASGFIGSFLCEKGIELGYEVWAGVRKTSSREFLQHPELNFIVLNFEDKDILRSQLGEFKSKNGRFDFMIHNAGITKSSNMEDYRSINFLNTRNFIEVITENDMIPDKFLFTSSLAAFGPGKDNSSEPIRLDQKPEPVNLYGKSKLEAEQYIQSQEKLKYIILRPTGVYGPRERDYLFIFKMINSGLEFYLGSDIQKLTFIFVKDLIRVYFDAIESGLTNKSYFLSESKWYETHTFYSLIKRELNKKSFRVIMPIWIIELLAFVNECIGKISGNYPTLNKDKLRILKATNWICETKQLKEELNFEAEYDLDKGIKETVRWYKENGWIK